MFDFPLPDKSNIGGVQSFQFAPVDDIDVVHEPVNGRILRRVQFKTGKGWNNGYHRVFSCTFECTPKSIGVYEMHLRGFYPGSATGVVDLFYRMSKYKYVLLYTDYSGKTYLAGSLSNGFSFKADYTTSPAPDGSRGYAFDFACLSKKPAVDYNVIAYTGLELELNPEIDLAYNGGNFITQWNDLSGNDHHLYNSGSDSTRLIYNATEKAVEHGVGRIIEAANSAVVSGMNHFHLFVVAKITETTTFRAFTIAKMRSFNFTSPPGTGEWAFIVLKDAGVNDYKLSLEGRNVTSNLYHSHRSSVQSSGLNTYQIYEIAFSLGEDPRFYINGVHIASTDTSWSWKNDLTSMGPGTDKFTLGTDDYYVSAAAYQRDLLLYSRRLSEAERSSILNYLTIRNNLS